MAVKWHHASTSAGNPTGRTHYDIGGDDNSNVALVYPSEDGDEDTLRKARLIAVAPKLFEFAQQLFNAIDTGMLRLDSDDGFRVEGDGTVTPFRLEDVLERGRKTLDVVKAEPNAYHSPPILGGVK